MPEMVASVAAADPLPAAVVPPFSAAPITPPATAPPILNAMPATISVIVSQVSV